MEPLPCPFARAPGGSPRVLRRGGGSRRRSASDSVGQSCGGILPSLREQGTPMTTSATRQRDRLRQSMEPFLSFFTGPFSRLNAEPDIANFAVGNPRRCRCRATSRRCSDNARAAGQGLVRLQAQRAGVAADRGGDAHRADRHGVGPGRRGDDERRLRGHRRRPADAARAGRRGDLPVAALVLLRAADPRRRRRAGAGRARAAGVRPRPRPHRGRDRPAHAGGRSSTARTTRPAASTRAEVLAALAAALADASERIGHPIWIISDEPYNRIVFDGREFHSPAQYHPHTIITYSYGKTLLAPGQRIGYLTVPPTLPGPRGAARGDLPPAGRRRLRVPERAAPARAGRPREACRSTSARCERRRDRLVPALREMGYEATMPEGTFYTMARSPIADDVGLRRDPGRAQGARPAGHRRRGARLVPHQPDRLGRDGRRGHRAVRRRPSRAHRLTVEGFHSRSSSPATASRSSQPVQFRLASRSLPRRSLPRRSLRRRSLPQCPRLPRRPCRHPRPYRSTRKSRRRC